MKGLVYLIAVLAGLTFWTALPIDPDLGWQLLGGSWILNKGGLPLFDPVNTFNPYWHDYHWLAQIIFYRIYELGSYEALRIFLGVIMASLFLVITEIIYLSMGRKKLHLLSAAFVVTSVVLLWTVTSIRPQMVAVLFIAIAMLRLVQKTTWWELPFLFFVAAAIVNMHVYWVFVPILWFIYRCLPRYVRHRALSPLYCYGGLLVLCMAGFISPYGIFSGTFDLASLTMNYALIWDYATTPQFLRNAITEFQSPFLKITNVTYVLVLYLIIIVRTFNIKYSRVRISNTVSCVLGAFLVFHMVKFLALFAVMSLPFIVHNTSRLFRVRMSKLMAIERKFFVFAVVYLVSLTGYILTKYFPTPKADKEAIATNYPVEACTKIADLVQNKARSSTEHNHTRVLTHFNYGGWCRWIMYEHAPDLDIRVTTDGRTQGVPAKQFEDSFNLYWVKEGWTRTLVDWKPDFILVQRDASLGFVLPLAANQWEAILKGNEFSVYRPVSR